VKKEMKGEKLPRKYTRERKYIVWIDSIYWIFDKHVYFLNSEYIPMLLQYSLLHYNLNKYLYV
jgi:hypothetical protein